MNWWFKMVGEKEKERLEINGLWVAIALEMELVMGHQPLPQGQSSGRLHKPHGSFLLVFGNAVCFQLTAYLQLHYGFPYLCGPCMPLKDTVFQKNFHNISSIILLHSRKTRFVSSLPWYSLFNQSEVNLRPQVSIVSLKNTSSPRSVPRQWWLIVLSREQN